MKRLTNILLFLWLFALAATGQEFKLWFANNVTDVQNFDSITTSHSGLNWREVHDKDIDGNSAEVDRVRQMLASTGMKGLEQQRQFWTMRDRTLQCFRIDDADTKTPDSYEVEVKETDSGQKLTKTVTKFFFVNLPLITPPSNEYTSTVTNLGDPTQKIRFKYTVYDWNNEDLYIFQLDRQRQLTGKDYQMDMQGRPLNNKPTKGLYIDVQQDQQVRKIVRK